MLVLSRSKDQKIVIDGNIVITILGVKGNQIRIGVDAPKHIPVHREEIEKKRIEEDRTTAPVPPHGSTNPIQAVA